MPATSKFSHQQEFKMSFVKSFISATAKNIHDGAILTLASWDPSTVGAAQLDSWNQKAAELADMAVKAAADRDNIQKQINDMTANISRYTAAAEKLAATNEVAANKAADQALALQADLAAAQANLVDAQNWAAETRASAETAEDKVAKGRAAIEQAKREQARAIQEKTIAEQRLKDRERLAGISNNLDGADVAINAMKTNAEAAKQKAAAANLRTGVLSKGAENDAAISAALAEVDGAPKPTSLADKLAALKK